MSNGTANHACPGLKEQFISEKSKFSVLSLNAFWSAFQGLGRADEYCT
jgi:hypothetical protein